MMPELLNYLIKVSTSLAILYLFYCTVLRKMTCYNWNRAYLLVYSLLSFLIPFLDVAAWTGLQRIDSVYYVYQLPVLPSYSNHKWSSSAYTLTSFQSILFYIFLAGVLVMLFRFIIQLISLHRLKSRSLLVCDRPVKIYHLNEDILPFSFNKSVFINRNQHSEEVFQEILNHELVHIRQKHTIDVLIAEIICVLNWYNPFAWLIKRAIKENLEFIADAQVVHAGTDKKQYQYHLLKVMGYAPSAIVSHFNFPSLKKRIVMMNKPQTGKIHLLKFLFIIPLVGISILAFRSANDNKNSIVEDRQMNTAAEEGFRLNTLTFYIKNQEVATLIKSAQDKSLLKPGQWLSLSLLQNESNRLKNLLREHGYAPVTDQTITFLMDSSLTNKSFSIRVLVNVPEKRSTISESNRMHKTADPHALLNQTFQEETGGEKTNTTSATFVNGNDAAGEGKKEKVQTDSKVDNSLYLSKK